MERQLASVQRISKIEDIPGADNIGKATVNGWEVVIRKEEFKEGDLCVYCEIDSVLPALPEFEFLKDRKYRIKTIRLKKQISQGICFPLSILKTPTVYEGMDVTDIVGVTKYLSPAERAEQEDVERQLNVSKNRLDKFFKRFKWYRNLFFRSSKKRFPEWITKTDEDRVQNFPDVCERYKDMPFEVTEKLDGQSATYFIIKRKRGMFWQSKWIFGVCSRNLHLTKPNNSTWWRIAKDYDIKDKMINYASIVKCNKMVIQGEIVGLGVQNNKYELSCLDLFVFTVIVDGKRMDLIQMVEFCNSWYFHKVPAIDIGSVLPSSVQQIVNRSIGQSILAKIPREGLVFRSETCHFKAVNPEFLLKYD